MTKFSAVILDIDGTLTPSISWYELTLGLGADSDEHKDIYNNYRDGTISYDESKQQLIRLWRNTSNANKRFIYNLFDGWEFYPEVANTVDRLKRDGYTVCIITGSFDIWAEVVAARLGIAHWYANTEFIWNENGDLVDYHYDLKQGEKKLEQLKQFCMENGLDPTTTTVVGDSDNDIELFTYTGNGIAVGKDAGHALREVAWKQIDKFQELSRVING